MNQKERLFILAILISVAIMVAIDLVTDLEEGVTFWHILVEGLMGVAALFGVFYLIKGSLNLKHKLSDSVRENKLLKEEARNWKNAAQKYIEGLSLSIDQQMTKWNLSVAEKEVALLLLKGLSLKEVAEIRNTTEKTARVQSISVYSKSGLSGRSELAAFFLEDLLQPQQTQPIESK